jgi:hypothetical protein
VHRPDLGRWCATDVLVIMSWRQLPHRVDELVTATAMTLAALEIYDRPLSAVT